jgi:acetolactate synthase I/II/III large subunit
VVPGSAHAFLDLMHERAAALARPLAAGEARRREWLSAIKAQPRLHDVENLRRSTTPIHPAAAIAALRKALPRDGIVLVDSGAHRAFAGHYWSAYAPRTYISATNLGPMGWAIPAAVGVQCARPDRRVAVITGDGCMQMHGIEVQTAARYRLPIVYVVINNSALGNVWLRARQYGALPAELTRSRLGRICARARGAGLHRARPGGAGEHVPKGARRCRHRAHRRQGRQELCDPGLRFQRRRARLVLSRIGDAR